MMTDAGLNYLVGERMFQGSGRIQYDDEAQHNPNEQSRKTGKYLVVNLCIS